MDKSLIELLREYNSYGTLPMHMPGHKRGIGINLPQDLPYELDITEIDGFDDLHDADGILREAMDKAAKLWGSENSYFLVGGSTVGILAGIRAVATMEKECKAIIARNSHKSVYHAVELCGINPIYIEPMWIDDYGIYGSINVNELEKMLEDNPDVRLVVITSPTYEGIISDIKSIAEVVHKHNAVLLVDEAHGAHLNFSDNFKGGAVVAGADIVVQSIHKTLLGLTQTAICHVQGERISAKAVERQLDVFETSSPSYPLMSSIDICVRILYSGEQLFERWANKLDILNFCVGHLKKLKALSVQYEDLLTLENASKIFISKLPEKIDVKQGNSKDSIYKIDAGKIVISTRETGITGVDLADILRNEYNIEVEMAAKDYIICMTSIGDSDDNYDVLCDALLDIDDSLADDIEEEDKIRTSGKIMVPEAKMKIADAIMQETEECDLEDAEDKVSAEYVWAYPPGVPIICPGEVYSAEIIKDIKDKIDAELHMVSTKGELPKVHVCKI